MSIEEAASAHIKPCRACQSPIHIRATKCVECGSAQDWTRFVAVSAPVLALLVALTSVLAFAIPIWKAAAHKPAPQPRIAFVDADTSDGGITITIANGGDAPMTMYRLTFQAEYEGRGIYARLKSNAKSAIVRPNDIIEVVVTPRDPQLSFLHVPADYDGENLPIRRCMLKLTAVTPDGAFVYRKFDLGDGMPCQVSHRALYVSALREPHWSKPVRSGTERGR